MIIITLLYNYIGEQEPGCYQNRFSFIMCITTFMFTNSSSIILAAVLKVHPLHLAVMIIIPALQIYQLVRLSPVILKIVPAH